MTDQPRTPGLAAALAALQAELPPVAKTKTAKVRGENKDGRAFDYEYKYADLADVTAAVMPVMGKHGLAFTCQPTLRDDGQFGLAYQLLHESGELIDGWYPLDARLKVQQIGGLITYARRYVLCSLTGIAAEEDTDGQHLDAPRDNRGRGQREKAPIRPFDELPRNQDGTLSRSRCTNEELAHYGAMTDQQQKEHNKLRRDVLGVDSEDKVKEPQAERLNGTPPDDPWLDAPPPAGLRTPHAAPPKAGVIHQHFHRLGFDDKVEGDRERRLGAMSTITGRRITSTNDLTAAEGIEVGKFLAACRNRDALIERLAVKAGEGSAP